ncbi:lipid-A-disaccharide synthase [Candidatus Babeliales bacterium]|nr:lipid-A-disaccharide synthase [Candidatus Babeliales bacterium]
MKKIFISCGEVSGDKTGSWYLERLKKDYPDLSVEAVGGKFLKESGVKIYESIEKLNVAGIFEIIGKLRFILNFLKKLTDYILENNFDEIILVDFPGFNLRLAKRLKKKNPAIRITYLSPPQIWIWGEWRIKTLKKFCDKLIVLYPFEVDWYQKRGLKVEFFGNPLCSEFSSIFKKKEFDLNSIALLPGSREYELDYLLPIFVDVVKKFNLAFPKIKFILLIAESFSVKKVEGRLKKLGFFKFGRDVSIVQSKDEKFKALSKCCMAITKPGTISLELSLLSIPALSIYKTSWLSYLLARIFVKVKYMSLPNIILSKPVYPEFIQGNCKLDLIFKEAKKLYYSIIQKDKRYKNLKSDFEKIRNILCSDDIEC